MADLLISGVLSLIIKAHKTFKEATKFSNQLLLTANHLNSIQRLFEGNGEAVKKVGNTNVQLSIRNYETCLGAFLNYVESEQKQSFYETYQSVEAANKKLKEFYQSLEVSERQLMVSLSISNFISMETIKANIEAAELMDLEILRQLGNVSAD